MNERPIITGIILDKKATKKIIRTAGAVTVAIFGFGFWKGFNFKDNTREKVTDFINRSEEHTSELQSLA